MIDLGENICVRELKSMSYEKRFLRGEIDKGKERDG